LFSDLQVNLQQLQPLLLAIASNPSFADLLALSSAQNNGVATTATPTTSGANFGTALGANTSSRLGVNVGANLSTPAGGTSSSSSAAPTTATGTPASVPPGTTIPPTPGGLAANGIEPAL